MNRSISGRRATFVLALFCLAAGGCTGPAERSDGAATPTPEEPRASDTVANPPTEDAVSHDVVLNVRLGHWAARQETIDVSVTLITADGRELSAFEHEVLIYSDQAAMDVGSIADSVVRVDSPSVRVKVVEHTKGLRGEYEAKVANGSWLLVDLEDAEGRNRSSIRFTLRKQEPMYD